MPSQVTYTGKIGPGKDLTAKVFSNVQTLLFDLKEKKLDISHYDGNTPITSRVDLNGGTVTISDTVSGNNHTWTISVS